MIQRVIAIGFLGYHFTKTLLCRLFRIKRREEQGSRSGVTRGQRPCHFQQHRHARGIVIRSSEAPPQMVEMGAEKDVLRTSIGGGKPGQDIPPTRGQFLKPT